MIIQTNSPYKPAWIQNIRILRSVFRLFPYLVTLWKSLEEAEVVHIMANSGWSWHLFATPAIWFAYWHHVPVIVNYRGGEAGSFLKRQEKLFRFSIKKVDKLIVPSGYLKNVFNKYGIKADIIPNLINLDVFSPQNGKKYPNNPPHLIVCRNLEKIYGNEIVIEAFSLLLDDYPGARLTIAGEGPEKNNLEKLVAQYGIKSRVCFTGRLDVSGMVEIYKTADIMVNASRVDNMPNVLLESMAMGVPIVTTDAGGIPFVVENEKTALLVPVDDPERMANAIKRLLKEPMLYNSLSENGRKESEHYKLDNIKKQWLSLYSSMNDKSTLHLRSGK